MIKSELNINYYFFQKDENELIKYWYELFKLYNNSMCPENVQKYFKNLIRTDFETIVKITSDFEKIEKNIVYINTIQKICKELIDRLSKISEKHYQLYSEYCSATNELKINVIDDEEVNFDYMIEGSDSIFIFLIIDFFVQELELFVESLVSLFKKDDNTARLPRLIIPNELFRVYFSFCIAKNELRLEDGTLINLKNAGEILKNYFLVMDKEKKVEYKPSTIGKKVSLSSSENILDNKFHLGYNSLAEVYDKEQVRNF